MERSSIFIPTISTRILTALFVSIDDGSSMQTDQPFPKQGFAPLCPDESKPRVGMLFPNIEDGIAFYNNYAALVGFDTRKSTSTKSRDGVIVWQYVVCNREGRKNVSSMPRPLAQDREDSNPIPKKKRRCISNRIGCKARVTLRLSGNVGYSIVFFGEHHNHPMVSAPCRPFLKLNRNLDTGHKKFMLNCAKANIGTMKSYRLFKESVGGYDNVGATAVDFKNFKRDLKAYIAGGDAQIVIDKLFRKHETCSAFFFEYDVDESDQLTRLFWCDPVARKNYSLFGDVVSFDATYETNRYPGHGCTVARPLCSFNVYTIAQLSYTFMFKSDVLHLCRYNMIFAPFTGVDNHCKCVTFGAGLLTREDDESYAWLFRCFLNAMGNAPKCIITDQDPSLRGATQKAFPQTSHRYCMWHIMKKVGGKVDDELAKDSEFLTKLNAIVWSHYLEPIDFEKKWHDLMAAYNLDNHKWFQKLFEIRFSWIPAYYRDLFMGGLLRTTSRSESENSFFDDFTGQNFSLVELLMQFESAMDSQRHKNADLNADDEACYPEFKTPLDIEHHAASVYTITIFYEVQMEISAACFSCRVLHVDELDGQQIPDMYITSRWCKTRFIKPMYDVPDADFEALSAVEEKKIALNRLWSDLYYCVSAVEQKPDLLGGFSKIIRQQKDILEAALRSGVVNTQNSIFECYYGVPAPANITVLPPQPVHNKGSGKRIKSAKELSIEQSKKNKRMCRKCQQLGYHDSRNCPKNISG
ncbi:unnamed protein product [Cuscuta campestris]|uniref:Uncharacterized protein n=1 Tax=Cuscuta campestris TaxID=132261 RepID=A0A484M5U6_9ASTE|nr:unnamed protein product [Cuscuta campestris]